MDSATELLKAALVGPVDHLGIAVKDLETSKAFYGDILGLPFLFEEEVETESVKVAAFHAGGVRIELLESTDPEGPIGRFVEKRGAGLHHICYSVPDIRQVLEKLGAKGIEPVGPAPRPGAHGCQVAFLHPKDTGGILVELSQPPFGGPHGAAPSEDEEEEKEEEA
jgi:methylmalonyl-CoA/ethylmalonyl-CoA epimerase